MTKRLDADVKVLLAAVRALDRSSSIRMLVANLEYLWDRYLVHANAATMKPWKNHAILSARRRDAWIGRLLKGR